MITNIITHNLYWSIPYIFLSGIIVVLLGYAVIYSKIGGRYSQLFKIHWLTIITLAITLLIVCEQTSILNDGGFDIIISGGVLIVNGFSTIIQIVVLLTTIVLMLLSMEFMTKEICKDFELSQLILLSTLGMLLLVVSNNLIVLYLNIELISLSLYVLAGIHRNKQLSTEASLKYFILGAFASGFLLFGSTIIYSYTGLIEFSAISHYLTIEHTTEASILIGALFIFVALLFKLAAAPFHAWAPDVYHGSPSLITAYFAIVPKIATLGVLVNLLFGPFWTIFLEMQPLFILSGIMSIVVGAFGALNQSNLKRLLAYSAIGHMGFIILGVGVGSLESLQASFLYILFYIIMSINVFSFVLTFYDKGGPHFITQLTAISRLEPILGITLVICLFSMAGVPPLSGFFSKYLVLVSLVHNEFFIVAILAVLASAISGFYYLRIIKWMFFKDSPDFTSYTWSQTISGTLQASQLKVDLPKALLLGSTLYLIITFLLFPKPILEITFDLLSNLLI